MMKNLIAIIIFILILVFGMLFFSTDLFFPLESLSELETSKLANEAYLDILVNLKKYDKNSFEKDKILEAAMRIARELDLVESIEEPVYKEFVPRKTIHTIISELTGNEFKSPIVIEDFYYMYDKENDYYYIVPVGTDWIHYDKLKAATRKGNTYEIHCNVVESDYNGSNYLIYDDMKILLKKQNNSRYIKYKLISIESVEKEIESENYTINQYGISELGRALTYYSFTPANYENTILLNFAIHGFEDKYERDGQVLVDFANRLIDYYNNNPDAYRNTRIVILPCSNPDGLYDGISNNGFGRCNASGIDLNRDFDVEHKVIENVRNKTLAPFSAIESRAIRDLVLELNPDVVIDFHGWENSTIGDGTLAEIFEEEMDLQHKSEFNSNCGGFFSYWAHQNGAESLLVEFADENIPFEKVINALDKII